MKLIEYLQQFDIFEPLLTSGLEVGKDVSLAMGTKPPTSSTRSIILSLIAAVVAIVVSLSGNVTPSLMVSPELILKYLASDENKGLYLLLSISFDKCYYRHIKSFFI